MKRLLAVFFVVFALVACSSVSAETIDIDSMTLSELTALHRQINDRIQELLTDGGHMIYQGTFVVGVDILHGWYLFTSVDDGGFKFKLYPSVESHEILHSSSVYNGDSVSVSLEDGMQFITYGRAIVQTIEKPIWAP